MAGPGTTTEAKAKHKAMGKHVAILTTVITTGGCDKERNASILQNRAKGQKIMIRKKTIFIFALTLLSSPTVFANGESSWGKDVTQACEKTPGIEGRTLVYLVGEVEAGKSYYVFGQDDFGGNYVVVSDPRQSQAGVCQVIPKSSLSSDLQSKLSKLEEKDNELSIQYDIAVQEGYKGTREEWMQSGGPARAVDLGPTDAEPGLDKKSKATDSEKSSAVQKETGTYQSQNTSQEAASGHSGKSEKKKPFGKWFNKNK